VSQPKVCGDKTITLSYIENKFMNLQNPGTEKADAVILIRLAVGIIFLSEGVQKFLFPDQIGAGRFAKIGLPSPEILGPFVGSVEIVCGVMLLLGLATRFAAVPLIIIMLVAIASTKIPIFFDKGFWSMAHESRTDFSLLLSSIFLVIVGGGKMSMDSRLDKR
jgi:putative oxidoreductase